MRSGLAFASRTKIPEDPIDVIMAKVEKLDEERQLQGLDPIINLGVGQPHLGTHSKILEPLAIFLAKSEAKFSFPYESLQGNHESLIAINNLFKTFYPRVTYSSRELMITNGATQAIHNALSVLVDQNDKVIVVEPYYSAYASIIKEMGGELVKLPTAIHDFRLSGKLLAATLQQHPNARLLILNYPNNPSGVDLTVEELEEVAGVLKKYPDLYILIDDVYRDLCTDKHYTLLDVAPALKDRCIMVYSASKGFALPGARIGMAGAAADVITAMMGQQAKSTSSISTLTERMLLSAIDFKLNVSNECNEWIKTYGTIYSKNRSLVSTYLQNIGFNVVPGGAGLFVLASADFIINKPMPNRIEYTTSTGKVVTVDDLHKKIGVSFKSDNDVVLYFLHTTGVAVIPGSAFGTAKEGGFLRFSCAKDPLELHQALIRIQKALKAIPGLQLITESKVNDSPPGRNRLFSPYSQSPDPLHAEHKTQHTTPKSFSK